MPTAWGVAEVYILGLKLEPFSPLVGFLYDELNLRLLSFFYLYRVLQFWIQTVWVSGYAAK